MTRTSMIHEWHHADKALWSATPDGFEDALARFCAATNAVVEHCDSAGRTDLAQPITDYKEQLLATKDRLAGEEYPTIRQALRALADRTILSRRRCLGSLDRLANGGTQKRDKPEGAGTKASKLATALALLSEHPDWTTKGVALAVGCHPKYLSGSRRYKAARKAIKGIGQEDAIRGAKWRGTNMDQYGDEE